MFCTTKNFYDDLLRTCSTLEAPSSSDLFIVLTCNWISCDIVSVSISGVMGLYFQKKLKTNDQTKHFISASNSHATRMTVHDQQNSAFKNVSVWKIRLAVTIKFFPQNQNCLLWFFFLSILYRFSQYYRNISCYMNGITYTAHCDESE